MLKIIAKVILSLSFLAIVGCGVMPQQGESHLNLGGISSGGLPFRCAIESGELIGRSYVGSGLFIEFIRADKAVFQLIGDDIRYVVNVQVGSDCFVTLADNLAPTLKSGRSFVMFHDLSYMTDWKNNNIVLRATSVR